MQIPTNINNIIQRIFESEDKWKALYMGAWGFARFHLEEKFKDPTLWNAKHRFALPASEKGYQEYTPAELHSILTSKDTEFSLGHLQTLFSLFEELITELCPLVCDGREIRANKFKNLKKFLLGENPYGKFKTKITEDEVNELHLVKETRNCYIHNGSKVDENWLEVYKKAKGKDSETKTGDELPVDFRQIEKWHKLIIEIVHKVKDSLIGL